MTDPPTSEEPAAVRSPGALPELARLFFKLGTTAFGGPAAHIAMMEDEVVHRRRWLSRNAFLDLLGATNLIPGPNSTEMAIHIGHHRGGLAGLVVAGCCFIAPAVCIVGAIAWLYVRFGQLPVSSAILYGVKPVIIAVVAQALWRLGRTATRNAMLAVVGILAVIANALGVNELIVLLAAAILVTVIDCIRRRGRSLGATLPVIVLPLAAAPTTAVAAPVTAGLLPMLLIFMKIGSILFGSGYVLLAFLRADLVEHRGWLTESQLLDAIAVGQVTPGPVFTTATFIGYLLAGPAGAAVATVGIFLPAFVFVALSAPLVPRLRRSPTAAAVLDGLNIASLALMAVVTWHLARAALVDPITIALAAGSTIALVRFGVNSTWLVFAGAASGVVADLLQ